MATTEELQAQFNDVLAATTTLNVKSAAASAAAAALTSAQGASDGARAEAEQARLDVTEKVTAFKNLLDQLDD